MYRKTTGTILTRLSTQASPLYKCTLITARVLFAHRTPPLLLLHATGLEWYTEPKKMILKLPKELELPRMKDHQMFDRVRIVELQDQLQDKFKALKVGGITRGGEACALYNVFSHCGFRVKMPVFGMRAQPSPKAGARIFVLTSYAS